jgi:hypothetical protein
MITPNNMKNYIIYLINLHKMQKITDYTIMYICRYIDDDYDNIYFTKVQDKEIRFLFRCIRFFLGMNINSLQAIEYLKKIQGIIDEIYLKNLIFSRRLLNINSSNDDLGEFLGELPALVKYKLHNILVKSFKN